MPTSRPSRGYSLVELVVVVAILALLAMVAVPAWRAQMLKAHRTEAREALLALATAQEKFYLRCNAYAPAIDGSADTACAPPVLRFGERSERGRYELEIAAADAASWSGTATARIDTPQWGDTACRVFAISGTGERSARRAGGTDNSRECWSR